MQPHISIQLSRLKLLPGLSVHIGHGQLQAEVCVALLLVWKGLDQVDEVF